MKIFFSLFNIGQGLLIVVLVIGEFLHSLGTAIRKPLQADEVSFGHAILHSSMLLMLGAVALYIAIYFWMVMRGKAEANAKSLIAAFLSIAMLMAILLKLPGALALGHTIQLVIFGTLALLECLNLGWCIKQWEEPG